MNLRTDIKTLLRPNVSLASFSTMQVGGPAKFFAEPSTEDELVELLEYARQENLPVFLLGKGSNVIFPDAGWPGLVITLIHYEQDKIVFDDEKCLVTVSAGVHLYRLVVACRERGFGGAEFLCNVPGTVGGGLAMNAGFSRFPGQMNEIGDFVEEVTVLDENRQKKVIARKDIVFGYRHSSLAGKIILSGTFHLWKRKPEDIQKEIKANFDYRNTKQDLKHPSSGSIFKNPEAPTPSAGKLVDQLGLKGKRVGDAMVSLKHGNYIINAGDAKSSDIVRLIHEVQQAVFNATGILLEPEVKIVKSPEDKTR